MSGISEIWSGNGALSSEVCADHPLAVDECVASQVLACIQDARQVCCLAVVNKNFYAASLSDTVWKNRLPHPVILNSISCDDLPRSFRDQYRMLCRSVIYDRGLRRFWLDPASGRDCYMVSARALSICWGETPEYWEWKPWPGGMFEKVAHLNSVCWFDIKGVFKQVLRPGKYTLSFRIQLEQPEAMHSWKHNPVKLSLGNAIYAYPPCVSEVYFDGSTSFKRRWCPSVGSGMEAQASGASGTTPQCHTRGNSTSVHKWVECDVGEFSVEGDNEHRSVEVHFSMIEIEYPWWKSGFVLDGAIIRPNSVAQNVTE
ncbi:hypothetical protein KP509_16G064700 [Ceratopteris richardii]|uniref:Uncharacterized protein n=1 Tax=Ceratopteris richardii TaxID=49495 RepID=A0A8T2T3X5_CERRI|nr:hypothetical protein KP509_16G064700 [Ceratopteris richardii]